jgi:alpha-amylase/alpha-mannosidase (GH57 family)
MNRYVCIHGHFYQPPRENAWLEEIEMQESAAPYHDWNERVTAECYAPNSASRILDEQRRIVDIVNNYSKISFNFGPTLLSWMERHAKDVYASIIEADRQSHIRFSGHGSALAQVYNHLIMPLANSRDKRTQVIWGLRDFRHRFGRDPEGMWLAETAVDTDTLEALAENGIKFTILAPHQARRIRRIGKRWRDSTGAKIDPKRTYMCQLPSGRTINLFFYDGPVSQSVAFSGLLNSGIEFAGRLRGAFVDSRKEPQMVHIATDGETYGHHHKFGDMALSYCLHHIEANRLATLTVYGEYLEKHPPLYEAEIVENTSWSCAHGILRWCDNCGCNTGRSGSTQQWRSPLRESLNRLRDQIDSIYEKEMSPFARDVWEARNDYIDVILDRSENNIERFFVKHSLSELSQQDKSRALKLLEMQRHGQLMFTSCGWFFDEISGIETTQILQYAARAIQLAEQTSGAQLEATLLEGLEKSPSNIHEYVNGARIYERMVKPAMVDMLRVGAHYGISSLFEDYDEVETIYAYTGRREFYQQTEAGKQRLAIGRVKMRSNITWSEDTLSFAVLHLGDHNLLGGVRKVIDNASFEQMKQQVEAAFEMSDLPEIIRLMDKHFNTHNYSLRHLFKDEKKRVFGRILESTLEEIEGSLRGIYRHYYPIMRAMKEMVTPVPKALLTAAEFAINVNLRREIESDRPDAEEIRRLVEEIRRWSFEIDRAMLAYLTSQRVNALMEAFARMPAETSLLKTVEEMLRSLEPLSLNISISKAQNILFLTGRQSSATVFKEAVAGDQRAREWVVRFDSLSDYLHVRGI